MNVNDDHVHRSAAEGFEREADSYRAGRPNYHPSIAQAVADRYATTGRVVELGAGTGIFTAELVAYGIHVTAVEPVAAMRSALLESVGAHDGSATPLVLAVDGTAEEIPLPNSSIESVIAAQSFHWFDHGLALDELARVIWPGGFVVTVWNVRDNTIDWVAACTELMDHHSGDTPRHRSMIWRRALEDDARFELIEDFQVPNPQPSSPENVVARCRSTSFIAALKPETRDELLAKIAEIVRPLGDQFDYPYTSELQAWRVVGP